MWHWGKDTVLITSVFPKVWLSKACCEEKTCKSFWNTKCILCTSVHVWHVPSVSCAPLRRRAALEAEIASRSLGGRGRRVWDWERCLPALRLVARFRHFLETLQHLFLKRHDLQMYLLFSETGKCRALFPKVFGNTSVWLHPMHINARHIMAWANEKCLKACHLHSALSRVEAEWREYIEAN